MSNITLNVSGTNKLDQNGKTIVVKDLILGANAEFTVSAGTSLTVGVNAQ